MTTNPEHIGALEQAPTSTPYAPLRPNGDTTAQGAVEASREGGAQAEALRIATELYGGKPPKDYVEKVREGLMGEDH